MSRFENVVFAQGDDADEARQIWNEQGNEPLVEHHLSTRKERSSTSSRMRPRSTTSTTARFIAA